MAAPLSSAAFPQLFLPVPGAELRGAAAGPGSWKGRWWHGECSLPGGMGGGGAESCQAIVLSALMVESVREPRELERFPWLGG